MIRLTTCRRTTARLKKTRHLPLFLAAFGAVLFAFPACTHAQRFDLAAGLSSINAPGVAYANSINHQPQSLNGGAYLDFSGDFLFYKGHIGVEGEFVRKESEGMYVARPHYPYRPLFYDANVVWIKKFHKRFAAELEGGLGAEGIRFYNAGGCSGPSCYANKYHFMGDFGAGVRIYPLNLFIVRHIFIRPEGRFYLIHNNQEFSSDQATRYGASIGYTF